MNILTLSGSLRAHSSNTGALRAAASLAPPGMTLTHYEGLHELPAFNPDLDGPESTPPAPVQVFRDALAAADGVLLSSPEYAHGVPGALKNALDWIVGSGELSGKPVLLINAAAGRGARAQAQLSETLRVMESILLPATELPADLLRAALENAGKTTAPMTPPAIAEALRDSLATMARAVISRRREIVESKRIARLDAQA